MPQEQMQVLPPKIVVSLAASDRAVQMDARWNVFRGFQLLLLTLALAVAITIDFVLLFELFRFLLEDDATATAGWSTWVFAGTGFVAVLAFHALHHNHHSVRFERGIASLVRIALALFTTGVGLLLAGMVYSSGANSLTAVSSSALEQWLAGGGDSGPVGLRSAFQNYILPNFPIIFSLGLGGCFVMSIFVAHVMLGSCHGLVQAIIKAASTAKESAGLLKQMMTREAQLADSIQALANRLKEMEADGRRRRAEVIAAACQERLREPLKVIIAHEIRLKDASANADLPFVLTSDEGLPPSLQAIDLPRFKEKVAAVSDAIHFENVLEAISQATSQEN